MNDDDLMARTAEGDEGAFRALVERWERPVFAFLDRMVGSREEAQDLGQETFLRVYRQAKRYRPEGRFKSWLFRIAGNAARSRLRRNKILRWVPFDPSLHDRDSGGERPDRAAIRGETERAVRGALGKLPERQRQALVLLRFEGLRYKEIAEIMGVTVAAVDSLIQRAMAGLKKELAGKAGER
ncbi:MAG: sigma-70 family RNA polymerase sigma factor [Candidatus Eisenbacteria bacterium]